MKKNNSCCLGFNEGTDNLWFSTPVWRWHIVYPHRGSSLASILILVSFVCLFFWTLHPSWYLSSLETVDKDECSSLFFSQLIGYLNLNYFWLTCLLDVFRGQINNSCICPSKCFSRGQTGFPTLHLHQCFSTFSILRLTGWARWAAGPHLPFLTQQLWNDTLEFI